MNAKTVDLRSDTCTLPSEEMRKAIYEAKVGDQAYGEDETTLKLEKYCAKLFGKEAALFMPSGTMSDQVAIRSWTVSGDEVILDESYHVNYFQTGPSTDLGKICLSTVKTRDGILTPEKIQRQMEKRIKGELFPSIGLIMIENTINSHSGKIFPLLTIQELYKFAQEEKIPLHIDGERILNACVAKDISPQIYGKNCDSITCSFSKGLGAPYGSILMGSKKMIKRAEKYRRWYGGSLHQSGFMAEAAYFAIKNNINHLKKDHELATLAYELLKDESSVSVFKPDTNIVMIDIEKLSINASIFAENCKEQKILVYPWEKNKIRLVTHLDITKKDIYRAMNVVKLVIEGASK
ncbi:aminotransferase class I/II-fold pyridoxal phosphate-dependent enzyme [Enterococcus sp. BWB1-3]|uniref:threonine aldolase family protein n=1 Tax=Enterococcus sp. BWB1-3 TaxID=2787713 RepID=UPI001920E705|nr:GntG family PLP-dependent aldolase [Enterococcus sp. BWB1-3]MBL1230068.1 aminotransferase class I/II-fold pyridoxal phosphate-dependent enzyme [Enterococcus sp. BWB1-3]